MTTDGAPRPAGGVRLTVWALHMALPMAGLWLLLTRPQFDLRWEHHPSHFGLVLATAAVSLGLSMWVQTASRSRGDARLMLVGLAFTSSAEFFFLHALATPGILLKGPNIAFETTSPFGVVLAAVFLILASVDLAPAKAEVLARHERALRWGVLGLGAGWAALLFSGVDWLTATPDLPALRRALGWVVVTTVALLAMTAFGFFRIHRHRPAVMLVALVTAVWLLAEAMVTFVFARNWQLSWWLWHLLLVAAFGYFTYSAYVQLRREGSGAGLFDAIGTDANFDRIQADRGELLESLTAALAASEATGSVDPAMVGRLAVRFELTEGQATVLERAAKALAHEREQTRRLGVLARLGNETRIGMGESELLERLVATIGGGFGRDRLRLGLVRDGRLEFPRELAGEGPHGGPEAVRFPLTIAGTESGVLEVLRPNGELSPNDRAIFSTLAGEIAIALENGRLYEQVEGLFRQYTSPEVAAALLADPGQARLGGTVVEVTAMFADLRGFTSFSETSTPEQVVDVLNQYFGLAVPLILEEGGTVIQFVGDALLAVFNAPSRQPDHELRACRAALAMQEVVGVVAASHQGWPLFRVGINTGPALVGNIGADAIRSYNVMGDAVNVAARLEGVAHPGSVVIGGSTRGALEDLAVVEPLGDLTLKGRQMPVMAFRLIALRG